MATGTSNRRHPSGIGKPDPKAMTLGPAPEMAAGDTSFAQFVHKGQRLRIGLRTVALVDPVLGGGQEQFRVR